MSEPAPESSRPRAVPPKQAGGGNFLTRKVGPLPTWAWLGIIGVGGGALWYFIKSRQNAAASSTTAGGATGNCTDTNGNSVPCDQVDYGGEIATLEAEIENLQQSKTDTDTDTDTPTPTPHGTCAPGYTFVPMPPPPAGVKVTVPRLPPGAYRVAGGYCRKDTPPKPQQLTRTWTSTGGSTLAAVEGRLGTKTLTPSNAKAKAWINGAYKRNHNAKMPKGLVFTYNEGTVTSK